MGYQSNLKQSTHSDNAKILLTYVAKHKTKFFLLLAIILSLNTHWMVLREWHMPTYGNTMIHIASARHVVEHGEYPLIDYSYGGGIANLYVPHYRMLVATTSILTGFSLDFTSRMLVLLFAILLPLGFFLLTRRLFDENTAVFAALFSILPGEMLIYTVRPLPQALGLILLPIAFHAFLGRKQFLMFFLAFIITFTHQEAVAYLFGAVGVFLAFTVLHILWRLFVSKQFNHQIHSDLVRKSLFLLVLCISVYLLWQFIMIGHINVFELAQFKNHEGNTVSLDSYLLKTGNLVVSFSLLGLLISLSFLLRNLLSDVNNISAEMKGGIFVFFTFFASALSSFFILNGFSLSRNASFVSISFPIFLGPLEGTEIIFISIVVALFFVFVIKALFEKSKSFMKSDKIAHLFLLALFFAGFFAVKNDAVGIRVFMDRFLVYLQQPLIIFASLGANGIVEFVNSLRK
ncbi:hypothetical protein HY989_05240 [Candidatus Micrarchaeota archaeon]|nr:hypothetical protein [Candidatus Micrarchaeota archaeon]